MENRNKIPNSNGTIFKVGKDIFLSYGDKTYATFGSEKIVTRKQLKNLAKAGEAEVVILVDNAMHNIFEDLEGRELEKTFFYTTRTPYAWSSGETLNGFNSVNRMPLGSLEEAKQEALKHEVQSTTERCVNVGFGFKYDLMDSRTM